MASKKKGWFNEPRSLSEPPPSRGISAPPPPGGEEREGLWARSEPPPASPASPYGTGLGTYDYGSFREERSKPHEALPEVEALPSPEPAVEPAPEPEKIEQIPSIRQYAVPPPPAKMRSFAPRAEQRASIAPGEPTTTIGRTVVIRGKLTSRENLIVQGRIEAEIVSTNDLRVEESGIVNADMTVKSVTISGIAVGDIHAEELVRLAPAARVVGDIYTPRLVVEDGATFRGRIEMDGLQHLEGVKPKRAEAAASPPVATTSPSVAVTIEDADIEDLEV